MKTNILSFSHRLMLAPALVLLGLFTAQATPSTTVVVSQVYGGGGNSGATLRNDFIELHNISSAPVSVAGWSVQYNSAAGTGAWQVTNLTGAIQPGAYYLVQEAVGTGGTQNLPPPDASGTIPMSATAGKVALVNNTTALTGASPSGSAIIDLVGFGTANFFEGGGAALAPSNTSAIVRLDQGSTDTDSNVNDFAVANPPGPRNSASASYIPGPVATKVLVETQPNGSGTVTPAQTVAVGNSITVYSITRTSSNAFVSNGAATWSLTSVTGGVVAGDLVPAGDNKSAVFTPHADGAAVIHATINGLASVDSGIISATSSSTNPSASANADSTNLISGQTVTFTVTVTPGTNPASTGLSVNGDLSQIGGSAAQAFLAGPGNTFVYQTSVPPNVSGGNKNLTFSVNDAQGRGGTASLVVTVRGDLTIFHTNDTHARVTPHKWVVPAHSSNPAVQFEDVGGVAYMGAKLLSLTASQPDALVLDGGDVSEGNPVGDWNGPGTPTGTFGDGTIVEYYKMLDTKLKAVAGRGGRGLDAMVVGNHDIRDISYLNNLQAASQQFPVISMNICHTGTHTPYFAPYVILNVNGNKIGVVGYTTESADSPEAAVNNSIDVVKCDWSSSDSTKIHFADYVNELRNNQGCNMVILLTHMGHSGLCTPTGANPTPILVDTPAAKLPEIVVSGHWHTYADTVWQPVSLNYKTIFTEAGSFQHYVGELRVNGLGKYQNSVYYPLRNSDITPDPEIAAFIQQRKDDYNATNPPYQVDQIIGYTADNLLLDNYMKWWSADEYPWSGNNTAGNWICDSTQWKATQLFGQCDLSLESGGGVRSDIVAGPIKFTNIYETFPWPDDTIYVVNMTGAQIYNYFKVHNCDAAMSAGWHVTAFDGVPTEITVNGNPISQTQTYKVAINNYMYLHDTIDFSTIDPNPQTSSYLARTALVEYTSQFGQGNPYSAGPERYTLNTEFSGGYRCVVTMMNDADTREAFEDGFIRFLSATPETLAHRGHQVPVDLVNADGTINRANRLAENEWYRSYLGFKNGALQPGDIVEIYGKGAFFGGNPEFVDQEGVQSDGVEFKIVGHDASLAQPAYIGSIAGVTNPLNKNHYMKFFANKSGASTVTDKSGNTLTIQDKTGYSLQPLPGNVGDLLVLTGVPTSESYSIRFRADAAVLASSQGFTTYPPDSHVNPFVSPQSSLPLVLTATAGVAPGANQNFYTLEPVADAQVVSASPTNNYGTSTNIFIQSSNSGSFQNERGWLRFDLSSLPAGSTIQSATLNLYCWRALGASLPAALHGGSTDTWGETAITWNNQPAFGSALDTKTLTTGVTNTWYSWDATAFAQSEFAGDKQVSLLVKPVTENSSDTTAPSYGFDSKEYTSFHPYLQVATPTSGTTSLTQVQFFYRYSADNLTNWTPWTSVGALTAPPWSMTFNYPNGYGFYEFYSVATDSFGAIEPLPPFADTTVHYIAAGLVPTNVVSRKTHGSAGTYDIDLLPSATGIECRSGGANGDYSVVFTFANNVAGVDSVSTSGTAAVSSSGVGPNAKEYVVNLTGVANQQHVLVNLYNARDTVGNTSASLSATLNVLFGDANGNGTVNASDITAVKASSGQATGPENFRTDLTANGAINASDVNAVKSASGTSLP